jgi:hypothetical protein
MPNYEYKHIEAITRLDALPSDAQTFAEWIEATGITPANAGGRSHRAIHQSAQNFRAQTSNTTSSRGFHSTG